MKANPVSDGLKYGIIGGLIFLLLHIGSWTMGVDTYVTVASIETFTPYLIALLIVGGLQLRKRNGNQLSFQEALKFAFLAYVIMALIEAIGNYVLFNILDHDLTAKVLEITREKTSKMMEKFGATKEDIAKAMEKVDKDKKETSIKNVVLGLGLSLIWYFIKALGISLIIKRDPKPEEQFLA